MTENLALGALDKTIRVNSTGSWRPLSGPQHQQAAGHGFDNINNDRHLQRIEDGRDGNRQGYNHQQLQNAAQQFSCLFSKNHKMKAARDEN